jgi:hypothetical protein
VFNLLIELVFRGPVVCSLIYFWSVAGGWVCSDGGRTRGGGADDTGQRRRHTPALPGARLVDNLLPHQVIRRSTLTDWFLFFFPRLAGKRAFHFPFLVVIFLLNIFCGKFRFSFLLGLKNSMHFHLKNDAFARRIGPAVDFIIALHF